MGRQKLYFFGNGTDLFVLFIVNFFLTLITLGIYAPWAQVRYLKYMVSHFGLDGEPFEFHGKGLELFIGLLKVTVLLILLLVPYVVAALMGQELLAVGFYIIFILILILVSPVFLHGALRYTFAKLSWRGIRMGYSGNARELTLLCWKGFFLSLITLGIYGFFFEANLRKYMYSHIHLGNITFDYTGRGIDLLKIWFFGLLLGIIALGIYLPWLYTNLAVYNVSQTSIMQDGNRLSLACSLRGGSVLWFWILRGLLFTITAGIATPWIIAGWAQMKVHSLSLDGEIDKDSLMQTQKDYSKAEGFGLFDFGEGLWGFVFPF